MEKLFNLILFRYAAASYIIKAKAKILLIFSLSIVPALIGLLIILNVTLERDIISTGNISLVCMMVFTLASISFLYKGSYFTASHIIAFILVIGNFFISQGTLAGASPTRLVASYLPTIVVLIFSILFCYRIVFVIVFLTAVSGLAYNIHSSGLFTTPEVGSSIGAFLISSSMSSLLCYLIVRIDKQEKIIKAENYSKTHNEQRAVNIGLLDSLINTSEQMDLSSKKLSTDSATFSSNMQSEASSIEEITATIEEISSGLENVSSNTNEQSMEIESLIAKTGELITTTREMEDHVRSTLHKTEDISREAESGDRFLGDMNISVEEIGRTSVEMTEIINIITEISDRINLLALNASIEAARAGDYGRGFAVVADEVSKLADQTTSSVKSIEILIKKSDQEISKGKVISKNMVGSIRKIIQGVNEINTMMNTINGQMERHVALNSAVSKNAVIVKNRSDEIQAATGDHRDASAEIVNSISDVNNLIQSNAISSADISASTRELEKLASGIKAKIASFDIQDDAKRDRDD
jgi:methyl-accepting chemotaxis protein